MFTRRDFLTTSMAAGALLAMPAAAKPAARRFDAAEQLRTLEVGPARLGVCFLDTATGEASGNRIEEYFALCSTFKLALVSAYLREADQGRINLDEVLVYTEADLLPWAPVTRKNLAKGGLSIAELAQAAQEMSDGAAANLLVRRLGGPAAVTAKIREMGDIVTRLDRYEPDLGLVLSADLRDTTSPLAMAQLVRRITTGDILQRGSRERLLHWMQNTKTGFNRLRAGLPAEWRSGNKTGTGRTEGTTNKCNDIAITFPPSRSPIIIATYFDSGEYTEQTEARHEAVLAEVGRIAAQWAIS
ncbi:class A beta-lactamase [Pseudoxanthomonas suwonensis]|uniref:beta-lactamase n=1 Tax=Pseudoxanthomonas suwonensis TaxID=314722 RepID=A0A0E3YZD1_9GAMM|nr:class A beta-lactamase [Pseudoxanthomonas suwonensis]AKC85512.1 beta-lactamase [Pseudoxanthomonas suwonensis]